MDDKTFARLFAAQYADFDADLPAWKRLAWDAGDPILEVGCGDGRVTRALARDGHEIAGIDTNPAMLARARQALPGPLQSRVHLLEQDVRQLELPQRFRLILAPCNMLAGLADADLSLALARLQAHLHPGGLLAFEVPSPWQAESPPDPTEPLSAFVEPETGNPVQVYADQILDPGGRRAEVTWRYDELQADGTILSHTLRTTFHLRGPDRYAEMLAQAGFVEPRFFGSYRLEPLTSDGTLCIVVCQAPGPG
jgi:SAM-dependent methyltransferase